MASRRPLALLAIALGFAACASPPSRVSAPPSSATTAKGACDNAAIDQVSKLTNEGRIARATAALEKIPVECRAQLGFTWGELVVALADLGKLDAARAEAARVEAAQVSSQTNLAAKRGVEHANRYAKDGGDLLPMLELYDRALAAERKGDLERANAGYLEAWARYRPNPQALVRAGRVAERAKKPAFAQRFYDRALAEFARTSKDAPTPRTGFFNEGMSDASVQLVPGDAALAVKVGGPMQILDAETFELLASHDASILQSEHSQDGRLFVTQRYSDESKLDVIHTASGHRVAELSLAHRANKFATNAALTRIAAASETGAVDVFDVPSARRFARLRGAGYPTWITFVGDGIVAAAFESSRQLYGWKLEDGSEIWKHTAPAEPRDNVKLEDRAAYLLRARAPKKLDEVFTIDLKTGQNKKLLSLADIADIELASRDLLVVIRKGETAAYDIATGKQRAVAAFGAKTRTLIAWSPDPGKMVLVDTGEKGDTRDARLWDPASNKLAPLPRTHPSSTKGVSIGPSGRMLSIQDSDTIAIQHGAETRTLRRPHPQRLNGVAVMPDGSGLVIGDDRGIRTLSFRSPALGSFGAPGLPNGSLTYSDDGKLLLAAGATIAVLDAKTGAIRHRLERYTIDAGLSADGTEVVAVDMEASVIWNLKSGQSIVTERESGTPDGVQPRAAANCCGGTFAIGPRVDTYMANDPRADHAFGARAMSADGKRVGIGYADGETTGVVFYDTAARKEVAHFKVTNELYVGELSLDRTGTRAAVGAGIHSSAYLFDLASGRQTGLGSGTELDFSRDGKLIVGLDEDRVMVWRAHDGELIGWFALSKTDDKSAVFVARDGRVEAIGKGVYMACAIGEHEVPFAVCADRLTEPGLIRRSFEAK